MKSRHGGAGAGGSVHGAPPHAGVPTLPKLTSLRFFAAFWVLGFHALPRPSELNAWAAFWNLGWLGVTFFFVLSGFILTYTYGRAGGRVDRGRFWVARFARVYPLYLFALAFALPLLVRDVRLARGGPNAIDAHVLAGVVVSSVTMMQSWFGQFVCVWNCPSWSLSDEAFFYLLFPFVVPLSTRRWGRMMLLALTLCGSAFIAAGANGMITPAVTADVADAALNPLARLPEFLLGVWAGGLFLARNRSWSLSPHITAAATCAVVAFATWVGYHPTISEAQLIAAPLFAILIVAVAASRNPERGVLAAAPLVVLGEASYALYILHGPLHSYMLATFNRVAPSVAYGARFILFAIAAVGLSIVCYRWIERPMRLRVRARLSR